MKGYKALLLDLDGTLLDIEVSFFLGPMVEAMHGCFRDLMDPEPFREALFGSIESIMHEPRVDGENNDEGFARVFSALTGVSASEAGDRFHRFYRDVFPALGVHGRPVHGAEYLVRTASRRGYVLALATNPIFPTSAVVERLSWAGLDQDLFHYIAGMETMRSCKPRVEYFLELAKNLGVEPGKCLMVGNDVEQDLEAAEAGMGTFLVEGQVVSRGMSTREPDNRGTLTDLAQMLELA